MEDEQNIGLKLKTVTDKIRQVGDATFAKYGLTGAQVGYLSCIHATGGTISQHELEKMAGVSHPTIVGVISRLSDKGYVKVETDRKDRRKRIISLTDKARNVQRQLNLEYDEMNKRMTAGMTEDEKEGLGRLLNVIEANLSESLSQETQQGPESGTQAFPALAEMPTLSETAGAQPVPA